MANESGNSDQRVKDNQKRYYIEGLPVPGTPQPEQKLSPWEQTRVVGRKIPRVDGYERVSGTATYPSDMVMPSWSCPQ